MLKNPTLFLDFILCVFAVLGLLPQTSAQSLCTGSLGIPIVNITFGSGNNPGPALSTLVPGASTTYQYASVSGNPAVPTPVDGQYTITNNVPLNGAWFYGQPDHTQGDVNGYMAFFNASETPGQFYTQTISGLCDNTTYEFAAWIANILDPAVLVGVDPDIIFYIEKMDGTLIASYSTGPINQNTAMTWIQHGFFFTTPANVNTVVLKMTNTNPGGNSLRGNDLAIDDITFRPCGPLLAASFDALNTQPVKNQCGITAVDLFGTVSPGYANPAFLWQVSTNNELTWSDIGGATSLNFTFIPPAAATYSFRVLSAESNSINSSSCRIISNTIKLSISNLPQAAFSGNTICQGSQGQFTFTASSGSPPFNIIYNDGVTTIPLLALPAAATINISPNITATTIYTLVSIMDGNGCIRTNNFTNPMATVTVNPNPVTSITGNTSVCAGDSLQLNTTGALTYKWTPSAGLTNSNISNPLASPQVATQYIVEGTSANGCKASDTLNITVYPKPVIIKSDDTTICKNSNTQLFASGGIVYSWSPQISLNDATISNPIAMPATNTTYYITVLGGNACRNTDSIKVSIYPDPVFTISSSKNLCKNTSVQLTANGGNLYSWQPSSSLNNASIQNPTASPLTTTIYSVQITDTVCNNSTTLSTTISVLPLPIIQASKSSDIDCSNDQSQLSAVGAAQYNWSPANTLDNSVTANPIAKPTTTTQYIVKGTDPSGCISYDSVTVNVNSVNKGSYMMPTAFTPNNDGLNDCYGIRYWGVIVDLQLSIYDRWGARVFYTTKPGTCWDGKYKGIEQPGGVYVYIIKAKTFCESAVFRKGTFALIR